jgi:hypothetical protein
MQSLDEVKTEDWKVESKRMENMFSSAYCTLAVHVTYDASTGPLDRKPMSATWILRLAKGESMSLMLWMIFGKEVGQSPLSSRGWVQQERILSRRTVHFSTEKMYFECGEGVCCENFTFMKR